MYQRAKLIAPRSSAYREYYRASLASVIAVPAMISHYYPSLSLPLFYRTPTSDVYRENEKMRIIAALLLCV